MVDLSVIIPVHKRDIKNLDNVISIINNLTLHEIEVEPIIVFNGMDSYIEEKIIRRKLSKCDRGVKIMQFKESMIIGKARNIGFKNSKGKYTLFVDSDVEIHGKSFKYISKCLDNMEGSDYVALHPNSQLYTKGNSWAYLDNKEDIRSYSARKHGRQIKILFGPFIIIKSEIFRKIGMFEHRVVCAEDRDIALRLLNGGYKLLYDETIKVVHHNPARFRKIIRRKIFHAKVNGIIYLRYPNIYSKTAKDWLKMYINILDKKYLLQSILYSGVLVFYTAYFYQFFYRLKVAKFFLKYENSLLHSLALLTMLLKNKYIDAIKKPI